METSLQFVILEHDHPVLHWDFMLEREGALKTWRLSDEPASGRKVRAEPIADHRIEYLDYEGPVSGNRGSVKRWDKATYRLEASTGGTLTVRLEGSRLIGTGVVSDDAFSFTATQ